MRHFFIPPLSKYFPWASFRVELSISDVKSRSSCITDVNQCVIAKQPLTQRHRCRGRKKVDGISSSNRYRQNNNPFAFVLTGMLTWDKIDYAKMLCDCREIATGWMRKWLLICLQGTSEESMKRSSASILTWKCLITNMLLCSSRPRPPYPSECFLYWRWWMETNISRKKFNWVSIWGYFPSPPHS